MGGQALRLDEFDNVAVGIAHENAAAEAELAISERDDPGGNESVMSRAQGLRTSFYIGSYELCLPVHQVARALIGGHRAAITRREVFEQLNARAIGRAQARDAEPRAEHVVQVLLLGAVSS